MLEARQRLDDENRVASKCRLENHAANSIQSMFWQWSGRRDMEKNRYDGVMFETEHLNRAPFEGPIWFSHAALVSPDLDRLIAFYGLLLDAKPDRRTNNASGPTFDAVADYDDVSIRAAWFDIGNMILEMKLI